MALVFGFGFLDVDRASAASNCACVKNDWAPGGLPGDVGFSSDYKLVGGTETTAKTREECQNYCKGKYNNFAFESKIYNTKNGEPTKDAAITNGNLGELTTGDLSGTITRDICEGMDTFSFDVFKCLLLKILQFTGWLLSLAATLFTWVIDPKIFDAVVRNNPAIWTSWKIVRDFLNLVFILVLLFSAFATVFQVDKYSYKKVLLNVVLMALLVNFSFPIARFIVDFANSNMYFLFNSLNFGSEQASSLFGKIADNSQLVSIFKFSIKTDTTAIIAAVVFCFILAVTLLAIAVLLVIRVVALAFLIIVSPVGFVATIIPGSQKIASDWWHSLIEYAMFGPTIAFFLYLAMQMMGVVSAPTMQSYATDVAKTHSLSTTQELIASFALFIPPLIMLWAGIGFAKKSSVAGASIVMGKAENVAKWGAGMLSGYRAASWTAKKAAEGGKFAASATGGLISRSFAKNKYGKYLVPEVYKRAYKRRVEMKDREAYEEAAGHMQDKMNYVTSFGKEKTDYGFKAHEEKVAKYQREMTSTSRKADYHIKEMEDGIKEGNFAKVEGALKALASANNLNDMIHAVGEKYGNHVREASPENFKDAIYDILMKSGMKDEQMRVKAMGSIEDIGVDAGNVGLAGMTEYDTKTNKWTKSSDDYQAAVARAKYQNMEPQDRQKKLHPDSVVTTDASGAAVGISKVQRAILTAHSAADVDQIGRSRDDRRRQLDRLNNAYIPQWKTATPTSTQEEIMDINKNNQTILGEAKARGFGENYQAYIESLRVKAEKAKTDLDKLVQENSALADFISDNDILVHNKSEELTKDKRKARVAAEAAARKTAENSEPVIQAGSGGRNSSRGKTTF